MQLSRNNTYIRLMDSANMWTAMNAMVDFGMLHRIPLVADKNQLVAMLSQSDVLKWALEFLEKSSLGDKSVRETSMGAPREVIQIHKKKTVKEAFTKIKDSGVSGIAIVSDFEDLYGNLSATDVKTLGLNPEMFLKLNQTIEEFLKSVPPNSAFGLNPIFTRPSEPIRILARKFVDSGVHRIYIVADALKIIGVISLVDFMKYLIEEASNHKTTNDDFVRN